VNEEVKDIGMGLGHVGTSTSLNILHQFWTCYYWISQKMNGDVPIWWFNRAEKN
jgi:hypothetical protein